MFFRFCIAAVALVTCLTSCARHLSIDQQVHHKVTHYAYHTDRHLKPLFEAKGAHYPPSKITLVADKRAKRLSVWAPSPVGWVHVVDFPILAASGVLGPKLMEGDHQVPEGIYHPVSMNPNSHFHLSIKLDYPNDFDRFRAMLDGRSNLGGQIFIHGGHQSIGCLAIGDRSIEELFVLVYRAGLPSVTVIIAPETSGPLTPDVARLHTTWVGQLYHRLSDALRSLHRKPCSGDKTCNI